MNAIYDLYQTIPDARFPTKYAEKQLHRIPKTTVVNRAQYLVEQVKGKKILDIGSTGQISKLLQKSAKEYHGMDKVFCPDIKNFYQIDLDQASGLPPIPGLELIIASEVIEHLNNAGHFLSLIRNYGVQIILTTPNAFSAAGQQWLKEGIENVNREHVAWYSYHTLKVLIERHNFRLLNWCWYNGKPFTAEGLIFEMEPKNGTT